MSTGGPVIHSNVVVEEVQLSRLGFLSDLKLHYDWLVRFWNDPDWSSAAFTKVGLPKRYPPWNSIVARMPEVSLPHLADDEAKLVQLVGYLPTEHGAWMMLRDQMLGATGYRLWYNQQQQSNRAAITDEVRALIESLVGNAYRLQLLYLRVALMARIDNVKPTAINRFWDTKERWIKRQVANATYGLTLSSGACSGD